MASITFPQEQQQEEQSNTALSSPVQPIQVAKRLAQIKPTIFMVMSHLGHKHQAINLGQGFPNFDGPDFIKQAAVQALKSTGKNQYARSSGVPQLTSAISTRFHRDTGISTDPDEEITVTCGCTEAISSTLLGLVNPGDEIITFAPFFDVYETAISMSGAEMKTVILRPPDFAVPELELQAAFTSKTRAILLNTPNNPTGKVFTRSELELISSLCMSHNALVFSDEVYSHLVYRGNEHISIASLPGMFNRTVTMSSIAKTYSLTGWKVGWAIAPRHLTYGIRQAHFNLTFSTGTPLQWGAAAALGAPDSYYEQLRGGYESRRDYLVRGLEEVGFRVYQPQGTFFVTVDHTGFGFEDDVSFCLHLVEKVGVVAIPLSGFYQDPSDGKSLVRFAFCKDEETLKAAIDKMKAHLRKPT